MSIRIDINHIINDGIAIAGTLGVLGAIFIIANKFFGVDSYNGLPSSQIANVIKNLNDNYNIISHVQGRSIWGKDYVRGILSGQGGQLYYYRFSYSNGEPTDIMIFPLYYETWSISPNLFDTATLLP